MMIIKCHACGAILYEGLPGSLVEHGIKLPSQATFKSFARKLGNACPYCGATIRGIPAKIAIKAEGALSAKERRRMK